MLTDVRIARIDGSGGAFAQFAFARRRARLNALDICWIAMGAWWKGVPAGMALVIVKDDVARLDSIMVSARLRRRGIAQALLASACREVVAAGLDRLETQYSSFLARRDAFESLLSRTGWSSPELIDIIVVGHARAMADGGGAWRPVQRAMRELVDYSVEPFAIAGAKDGMAVDALLASEPELGVPDPRADAATDPDISVTIRHRGALIGWVAAQRLHRSIGHGTLIAEAPSYLYSGARLADGHHKALMLVAYYTSFSRQADAHGPGSRAVYRTHPRAAAMYAFTRARFEPMALHVEERLRATLDLTPALIHSAETPRERVIS